MDILSVSLIGLGLAMDTFAVTLSAGTQPDITHRSILRMAFHFGLFQGLMTLIGWLGGTLIAPLISSFDHWVIFVLLAWVGYRMIRSGLNHDPDCRSSDPSRGRTLIMLCFATSLDALTVGISLAMFRTAIGFSSLIIGVITFIVSGIGGFIGSRLGLWFGKRMEVAGGILLIGIGLRILLLHLL